MCFVTGQGNAHPGSCRGSFQKVLQRGMVDEMRSERVKASRRWKGNELIDFKNMKTYLDLP